MHPSHEDDPHTLCPKCKNFVRTQNFLIHEARCKGSASSQQQSPLTSRILESRSKNRMPIFSPSQNNRYQETQIETIPCHFCSYPQTLTELDTHPQVCPHREQQCTRCKGLFPKSLMQQHEVVCPANRQQVPHHHHDDHHHNLQRSHHSYNFEMDDEEDEQESEQERVRQQRQQLDRRNRMLLLFQMMGIGRQHMEMLNPQLYSTPQRHEPRRVVMSSLNDFIRLVHMIANNGHHSDVEGMQKQEIEKFPVAKYRRHQKQSAQPEMCIICYCNFEEGQNCMTLPCNHIFHPECIGTWLQKNASCPICKKKYGNQQQGHESQPSGRHMFNIMFRRL